MNAPRHRRRDGAISSCHGAPVRPGPRSPHRFPSCRANAQAPWLHDAVDDHGRSEPRSKAQESISRPDSFPTPAWRHRSRPSPDDRMPCKIESHPSASQVVWFGTGRLRAPGRIADRDHVIRPPAGELLDPDTIRLGVNVGLDGNERRSVCPVARILTEVPPTSTTTSGQRFAGRGRLVTRARFRRPVPRGFAFTALAARLSTADLEPMTPIRSFQELTNDWRLRLADDLTMHGRRSPPRRTAPACSNRRRPPASSVRRRRGRRAPSACPRAWCSRNGAARALM